MELIMNDFSLRGQFAEIDDFEDYFIEYLDGLLNIIIDKKITLLKKSDTYSRKITEDITMAEYLKKSFNRSVATRIKQKIVAMSYSAPYWDIDGEIQSKAGVEYRYNDKQPEPNCFTEAIERKCPLLSVQEEGKTEEILHCYKDNELVELADIRDIKTFLNEYLRDDVNNIRFVIEHYPVGKTLKCAGLSDRCQTEEALLESNLNGQDLRKFVDNLQTLIDDKSNGRKTHWWDSLKGDICEYRLSVSGGRELRVLFHWGNELIFLNGFIKKTEKTPPEEIERAEKIKSKWIQ